MAVTTTAAGLHISCGQQYTFFIAVEIIIATIIMPKPFEKKLRGGGRMNISFVSFASSFFRSVFYSLFFFPATLFDWSHNS